MEGGATCCPLTRMHPFALSMRHTQLSWPAALHCSKSQIQTYLEQNEGPGLQHMALKTDDIVGTMRQMRARCGRGGRGGGMGGRWGAIVWKAYGVRGMGGGASEVRAPARAAGLRLGASTSCRRPRPTTTASCPSASAVC